MRHQSSLNNQRLGSVTIARRLGGHPSRILHALDRFGIPVRARPRPGDIDVECDGSYNLALERCAGQAVDNL